MKRSIKKLLGSHIKLVTQAIIAAVCIGTIIYFMPRNNVFNYNYSESAPWNYGQIIATFNFPIYKSDTRLSMERDSIAAHFEPYFKRDSAVVVKSKVYSRLPARSTRSPSNTLTVPGLFVLPP